MLWVGGDEVVYEVDLVVVAVLIDVVDVVGAGMHERRVVQSDAVMGVHSLLVMVWEESLVEVRVCEDRRNEKGIHSHSTR
jgi:hypothetical protein